MQVEVFGSFKTGLYLPSSDIDVIISSLISFSYSFLIEKVVRLIFVYEYNDKDVQPGCPLVPSLLQSWRPIGI